MDARREGSVHEVLIVGAGIGGLAMAIELTRAGIDDFLVLEKAADLGGTWRDNAYPGAACDIPAMFYSFSFEPKTDWSRKYPPQPEIQDYLHQCARKYGALSHVRFGTEVSQARFDESCGVWGVTTADGRVFRARVLVCATGQLHRPHIPAFAGLTDFAGCSFHSARWDHTVALAGKRVAVIGNGASAIQFVPEIARTAARLTIFQRSANWILPRGDHAYGRRSHALLRAVPPLPRLLRYCSWAWHEALWPLAFIAPPRALRRRLLQGLMLWNLRRQIKDTRLRAALTPDYPAGCKRILLSDDYYATLNRDNVELITAAIRHFEPEGIRDAEGRLHAVDVAIFATGFKSLEFVAPMRVFGLGGRELQAQWSNGAEAYLGVSLPRFPNFFLIYGPNTNLGHNSIIFMIEQQTRYLRRLIQRLREPAVALELVEPAMQRWRQECAASLKRTVWSHGCRSWYKTADGRITNNWPYSTITYWLRMRRIRWADYRWLAPRALGIPAVAGIASGQEGS